MSIKPQKRKGGLRRMIKRSKYGNRKTVVQGVSFDSRKESLYYLTLRDRLKKGEIKNLILQPEFILQPSFMYKGKRIRAIKYIADFMYEENDILVIEDVKADVSKTHYYDIRGKKRRSRFTGRTDVYKMKKKMLLHKHPDIEFKEI